MTGREGEGMTKGGEGLGMTECFPHFLHTTSTHVTDSILSGGEEVDLAPTEGKRS
jgi:hypothetical protein